MTGPLSDATGLFVAVDVHYLNDAGARAALVEARDQRFSMVTRTQTAIVGAGARYQPGKFYLRELPPLRAVVPATGGLALIVVDGYVDLDPTGRLGLGAHVHAEFGVPVVGVAKSAFRTATHAVPVCRGQSSRPLYVTAAGMAVADAAHLVAEMAGRFRLPDALKRVDRLARGLELPSCAAVTAGSGRHERLPSTRGTAVVANGPWRISVTDDDERAAYLVDDGWNGPRRGHRQPRYVGRARPGPLLRCAGGPGAWCRMLWWAGRCSPAISAPKCSESGSPQV